MNPHSETLNEKFARELSEPLKQDKPLSIDTMRLLVHAEKQQRLDNGENNFDAYVVDAGVKGELTNFLNYLREKADTLDQPVRIQLAIKKGAHYTAVDIQLSNEGNKFFMLDAAGDNRAMIHYMALQDFKDTSGDPFFTAAYVATPKQIDGGVNGALQKDFHSCPAFTLDHLSQVSRIENIYEIGAKETDEYDTVSWSKLPPQLVWNSQSMTWLAKYQETHSDEVEQKIPGVDMTFNEYLAAGKTTAIIKDVEKPSNGSAAIVFGKFQEQARKYSSKHENEIENIVRPIATVPQREAVMAVTTDEPEKPVKAAKKESSQLHIFKSLAGKKGELKQAIKSVFSWSKHSDSSTEKKRSPTTEQERHPVVETATKNKREKDESKPEKPTSRRMK